MKIRREGRKKKSLQMQLLNRFFLVLFILLTVLGLYQHTNMKKYLYESKVEFLDSRFKNINKEIILETNTDELLMKNADYILNQISVEDVCVSIINRYGENIASKNLYTGILTEISNRVKNIMAIPEFSQEDYLKILGKQGISQGYTIVKDNDNKEQIIIWREIGDLNHPSGLVQISTYIDSANNILSEQARMYVIAAIIILIVGAALALAVLRHTLKPLKNMTSTLDTIDTNALNLRLDENSGQIEIDKLSSKFNSMFERLEKAFIKETFTKEKMKNFILDASHELRTPLTSIQGFIEVLQMGAAKNEKQLDLALNSILVESQRLSKLVNNLLLLTKLEDDIKVEMKEENINEVIYEIEPQLNMLMKKRQLNIILQGENYSEINKDQIKQVIYNLVQNAVNYTNENIGEITISTKQVKKENLEYVKIDIMDNGEGIPEENLKLIFDRFYRADGHRARKKGGYGLGLSIVKSIINNHKGQIEVKSKVGKGTTFSILLLKSK